MANLQQVGIEFQVKGEATASQALKRFADSGDKVGTSVTRLGDKISGVEREYRKLNDMNKRGVTTTNAMETATNKLAHQLSTLTGMTQEQARAALKSAEKSRAKAEADKRAAREAEQLARQAEKARKEQEAADRRAAQAAEQLARAQKNLEGSVLKQARAVDQAVRRMEELKRLQQSGAAGSRDMAKAEIEVARALARTNGYLKSNGDLNTQKALAELRAAQTTREAAQEARNKAAAEAAAAQSYRRLKAAIDPAYASQQRLTQGVQTIRAALRAKEISLQEATIALRQLRASQDSVAQGSQFASRGLNRTGVVAQQAGYQVGDFFVQIQSGTNMMVAFGQQATQLVGTFAMFARTTRAAMIASGIGIFVSIATAVGAAIMRMNGQMETLDTKVQKLETSFNDVAAAMDRLEDSDLSQTFGNLTSDVQSITSAMVELNNAAALTNLTSVFEKLEETADAGFLENLEAGVKNLSGILLGPFAEYTTPEDLDKEAFEKLGFDMARSQYLRYLKDLRKFAGQGDIEAVTSLIRTFFEDATDGTGEISAKGIAVAQALESAALQAAKFAARQNGSAEAAKLAAAEAERQAKEEKEKNKYISESAEMFRAAQQRIREENGKTMQERIDAEQKAAEEKNQYISESAEMFRAAQQRIREENGKTMQERIDAEAAVRMREQESLSKLQADINIRQRRLEILRSYNSEGEKTAKTLRLENSLNADILRKNLEREASVDGITEAEQRAIDKRVELYLLTVQTEQAISNSSDRANDLKDALNDAATAMDSLRSFGQGLERALEVARAKAVAIRKETNEAVAGQIAGMRFDIETKRQEAVAAGGDPLVANAEAALASLTVDQLEAQRQQNAADRAAARADTGGASGGVDRAKGLEEHLHKLRQQAELESRLVGLFGEKRATEEAVIKARQEYGEVFGSVQEAELRGIFAQIQAEKERQRVLEEAQARQQSIADTIENSMSNAFMSIVDGTKSAEDAFRTMAATILKELFNVLVVQQLVGSFNAATGVGSGIVGAIFGAGFANGGVFKGGNVTPFANGGVVGGPTYFPMRNGSTGLMGEAGPEAIMPLKRTKGGKLGVVAEGGGGDSITVENHFHIAANGDDSVKRIIRAEVPRITEQAKAAVVDAKQRGGSYGRAFR